MNIKITRTILLCIFAFCAVWVGKGSGRGASPRIINIVNFIRQTDYRIADSDSLLLATVAEQIKLVNRYGFPATFLFQYDALINPAYQQLMKSSLSDKCEIGAWWEITQPHAEAAGIGWRGRHSWDHTANVAFTTGYTPQEREKLVDVYMAKFKEIYGYYPKSVGSWYIDSHSLNYMYEKYGIVASCNCKDQSGTDGYTLWGGYWNQAYYPSRKNGYMPAQTVEEQIPVPVFRMLGSDPLYQYDNGVGHDRQGVISLEPVYRESGKDRRWVEYFLESIVNQPSLAFNYAQAGQENSFTWNAMSEGLEMQFPIFDSLSKAGKIRLETLGQSGLWFKENFTLTPATAVTTLEDVRGDGNKGVWYNSRYYRANLFWEKDRFCFRDIHFFDERFESEYLTTPGTGGQFLYFTLPVVDRYFWSTPDNLTGLRIIACYPEGGVKMLALSDPIVTEPSPSVLKVVSDDAEGNRFTFLMREDRIEVSCRPNTRGLFWVLELKVPESRRDRLPFRGLDGSDGSRMKAHFRGFDYTLKCLKGMIESGEEVFDLWLIPDRNKIVIDCANR